MTRCGSVLGALAALIALGLSGARGGSAPGDSPPANAVDPKDRLVVETVSRIQGFNLETASGKVKDAVARFLAASLGEPRYFDLVSKLRIASERDRLVQFAAGNAPPAARVRAVQLALEFGGEESLRHAISSLPENEALSLVDALSPQGGSGALAILGSALGDAALPVSVRRRALVQLGTLPKGQEILLNQARSETGLDPALRLPAAEVLLRSADPSIATEAAKHLQLPTGSDAQPLPPVAELVSRRGEAGHGSEIFGQLCAVCHLAGDQGIDFGPALTEIGSKLAREALFESILNPSAAISFGYEGYTMELAGDQSAVGILASETDAELTLKLPGGLKQSYLKAEVIARRKLPDSLMPAALTAALTAQDLVDLVEYLTTLRRAE